MNPPRNIFGLCLVVNHACNLRCSYCYSGAKFSFPMPRDVGETAIERAFRSLSTGGRLDLGFFGGEPLLECARLAEWMRYARTAASKSGKRVGFSLTTNGTIAHQAAWEVFMAEDMELAVSFDGIAATHDRHRLDVLGKATAHRVETTMLRLIDSGKPFRVVVVVRPDNLAEVPRGLQYLREAGVRAVELSLDL